MVLSIDINAELERMAKEWGYTDKEVTTLFRKAVRDMWGGSKFKLDKLKESSQLVVNTNPRSMKKYPEVTKYTCAICGEMFGSNDVELDHINDENPLTKIEQSEDFLKSIFFTSFNDLQVLCKDRKKTIKGKKVITDFGCHPIKTYASRYNVSFEQARIEKEFIQIKKDNKVVDMLIKLGVKSIPKLKKYQESLLKDVLLKLRINK